MSQPCTKCQRSLLEHTIAKHDRYYGAAQRDEAKTKPEKESQRKYHSVEHHESAPGTGEV